MLVHIKRRMVVLAMVIAPLACVALPSLGMADKDKEERPELRKGVYEGVWHTDPVTFIIEKVERDGSFTGEIHFDPKGRWGDVRAPFTAHLGRDDSITMSRDDCFQPGATVSDQIAKTGRPERRGRAMVWKGEVKTPDWSSTFELRIPEGRR
jgi:hypothetical protein